MVHVACLCAAWCRLCEGYTAVLHEVVAALQAEGRPLHLHWIDIEDDADLVGDVDVETFPTLVVASIEASQVTVRFAGPVTPQPAMLSRLLRAAVADAARGEAPRPVPPPIQAFAQRLLAPWR